VASCQEPLDAQAVGNAIYGLQNLGSDKKEVLELVSVLASRVASCQEPLSAQNVGNAIYGLQNLSSDKKEVLELVSALLSRVASCQEPLDAQAVGNAMFGLSNICISSCKPLVEKIVFRMFDIFSVDTIRVADFSGLISGADAVLQSRFYSDASWITELEARRGVLSTQLQLQECPVTVSRSETWAIRVAEKLFNASSWQVNSKIPVDLRGVQVHVATNNWLHGYKSNIVLRIGGQYRGSKLVDEVVVNVELHSPRHDSLKSRRFCSVRDWRMRQEGVRVERWKVQLLHSPGKIEELLIELVQNVVHSVNLSPKN
jgi:uncharacterized protein YlaN (UPF0358 family)